MRKLISLLLVVMALTSFVAACAAPTPEVIEKEVIVEKEVPVTVEVVKEVVVEKEVEKGVTIEYWQYAYPTRVDAMNRLIQQFEAENPGIQRTH